jgi:Domain of unknown function (DUF5664)
VEKESDNPKNIAAKLKVDISLLPSAGIIHGAHACMDGAEKYGPYNWREKDIALRAYAAAATRHIMSWLDGEDIDPQSGVHHLGHAIAGLSIALDAMELGRCIDDRPVKGNAAELLTKISEKKVTSASNNNLAQDTNRIWTALHEKGTAIFQDFPNTIKHLKTVNDD